jgi:hypothetical protein
MKAFGNMCYAMGIVIALGLVMMSNGAKPVDDALGANPPCTRYKNWISCNEEDPNCDEKLGSITSVGLGQYDARLAPAPWSQEATACVTDPCGPPTNATEYTACTPE